MISRQGMRKGVNMGTWGSGNLDSDGALDYRDAWSEKMVFRMLEILKSDKSWEDDKYHELFMLVEWSLALREKDIFGGYSLPPSEELNSLFQTWLAHWDVYCLGLAGPGFKAERLAVIEKSFEQLMQIAKQNDED